MYKLCAFDLDGTLVDTIGDLAASLNYALEKNGLPVHTVQEVSRLVGHSVSYMCYMAVPEEVREARWQQVYADCDTHYALHCCDHSRPYEGILRTVSRLKAAGVTLAVVTNKPHKHAMHVVNELFPRDTFSIILGMMKKFEKKPAAEPLNFVLDYLGVAPKDAIYVGDSEVDIEFAKNTGLPCVSVTWGLRPRSELIAAGATCLIDDPEELLEIVL